MALQSPRFFSADGVKWLGPSDKLFWPLISPQYPTEQKYRVHHLNREKPSAFMESRRQYNRTPGWFFTTDAVSKVEDLGFKVASGFIWGYRSAAATKEARVTFLELGQRFGTKVRFLLHFIGLLLWPKWNSSFRLGLHSFKKKTTV